jgi:hypothetical protein
MTTDITFCRPSVPQRACLDCQRHATPGTGQVSMADFSGAEPCGMFFPSARYYPEAEDA